MIHKESHFFPIVTESRFGDKENQMAYTVISDREVCGKKKGESITDKELVDVGVSAQALISANHIKTSNSVSPSIKPATEGVTN